MPNIKTSRQKRLMLCRKTGDRTERRKLSKLTHKPPRDKLTWPARTLGISPWDCISTVLTHILKYFNSECVMVVRYRIQINFYREGDSMIKNVLSCLFTLETLNIIKTIGKYLPANSIIHKSDFLCFMAWCSNFVKFLSYCSLFLSLIQQITYASKSVASFQIFCSVFSVFYERSINLIKSFF